MPSQNPIIEAIATTVTITFVALLAGIALQIFWVFMLVDLTRRKNLPDKATWAIVVILGNWIGALVYLFGSERNEEPPKVEALGTQLTIPPPPVTVELDPDAPYKPGPDWKG